MKRINSIEYLLRDKKDWLILMTNLFLLLFPIAGFAIDQPFMVKKSSPAKSITVKEPTYILLSRDTIQDSITLDSLAQIQRVADSNTIRLEMHFDVTSLLPASLLNLHKDTVDKQVITTFFYPHLLTSSNLQETDHKKNINDWAFVILITGFLLFAAVQFSYHKRMLQIMKAFLAARFMSQLMRGSDFYKERITYNLYIIFLLVFPLFLFEVNQYFQLYPLPRRPFTEILFYLELFFLNLTIYSVKVIALRSAGNIFKTKETTSEYLMTHFIFSLVQGVVVLVFIALVVFTHSPLALKLGILLTVLIYFFQLLRGFSIGLRNAGYSVLYLLLFFFTIEILPLLFLVKLLSHTIAS